MLPAVAPLDGAAAVPQAGGITQENGVGPAVPAAAGGGDQRDSQSFDTQIQETSEWQRPVAWPCPSTPLASACL